MPNWTEEQKQAIYEKNSNLLVAAAAGSGKTAVLVERIINKAVNENVDINKLLVVTFTNAAASEMRERVLEAIYKKLDDDPDNERLQRQITLLSMSNICTIDSFCLEVVKNYFYELDNISPNFRIADTTEIELLKQEILDEVFEEKYLSNDEDFSKLITTYTSYKDDTPLKDLILSIYNYIGSSPYPLKWLNEKIEMFNIKDEMNQDFSKTKWGQILLKDIEEELIDYITILTELSKEMENNDEVEDWKQAIDSDIKQYNILKENLNNWDNTYQIVNNFYFADWSRKKAKSESAQDIKKYAKDVRDDIKDKFKSKCKKILVTDSIQSNKDIYDMYLMLKRLENIIIEFDSMFAKRKREKNIVDFSDIEHFALNILVKDVKDGEIIKTDVAKIYTDKFEEIAIDEYQDSNLVQEYILKAVSRENNMFMVGDVKQSIYRFRQAMPILFMQKYKTYSSIESKENDRKIQLFKNFRSRDNILEFANLVFSNIMSEKLGEVDYNKNEYLNFGAEDYKEISQNLNTEIDIIDLSEENISNSDEYEETDSNKEENEEYIKDIELEAKYVANKIKKLIDSKYQVYDRKNKIFRDVSYKDIAILLRTTKDKASIYEKELMDLEIPVFSDSNQEYLDSIEIQTIISLLKIIDNPMQDIPLVTVLRSAIGGFTDDELVEIRLADKNDNFYLTMKKAVSSVSLELSNKIKKFLEMINKWREEQEYFSLDEFIWKIYSDTGYYNYVGLMPNGLFRQENLKMLFERARKYESASFKGLYNFINFIEKLKENSGDLGAAKLIGENDNVVRIMSIHKSKGLEFPIVFLVNTNKKFNEQDLNKNPVLLHQEVGIGVKYIDYNLQIKYDTLSREAVKNVIRRENISEEMRVLYVALTRPKEKLFIIGIDKNLENKLEKIQKQTEIYMKKENKINPILVRKYKSYLDWILLVAQYEKNSKLFEINKITKKDILKFKKSEEENKNSTDILKIFDDENKDNKQLEKIKLDIEYEYKNKLSTEIPTQMSVTDIKQMKSEIEKDNDITFDLPMFLREVDDKITTAQKGTLIHLCMQKLNPKVDYNLEKLKELLEELKEQNLINDKEKDAINPYKILSFTQSKIWERVKRAKEVYKEKPFYMNVPAKEIYNKDIEEEILVQGIIDLYFIDENNKIVLVDYKTDYVESGKEKELLEKYKEQLQLYKRAIEGALNKKVDEIYIYSTYLEKELELK